MKKIFIILITFLSLFIFLCGCENKPIHKELLAFTNGQNITGSFFLGTGFIDQKPVYTYLYKDGNGIRQSYVFADRAIIFEQNKNEQSYVILLNNSVYSSAEFYIPEGSVKYNFSLDLNNK